ncbi:MAG: LysR family transcriptional regulator [Alphaproteobacteria bacterium]|nr:LysR family transcriptional regulator [Alphaproteobacteria bacterium]
MDLSRLDLNLLRVFEAVLAEGHVTRAAQRLGLTQPAVSGALARLRAAFADPLFVRVPGGVEPSALARELAGPVQAALDGVRTALALRLPFDPATAETVFAIGMSEQAEAVLTPSLIAATSREAPRALVAIRHTDRLDALARLDDGTIELALGVLPDPPPRFTRVMLLRDSFVALMRPGHPLARGALTLEGFTAYPHLLVSPNGTRDGALDQPLAAAGHPRRLGAVVAHYGAVPPILMGSDLICTFSGRLARPMAAAHGLLAKAPPVMLRHARLGMIWHRRHDRHPAHTWLRRRIQALARALEEKDAAAAGASPPARHADGAC